jgi:hypothetical protein
MAVEPEEGGKLAHGRLQSTLPVRAKTRRQTITSDGTQGLLCLSSPGRRQRAIFLLQQRSVEEVRSLLGGTHAMKSVKSSIDIIEGLSTGVNMDASAPHLIHK